ncbi:TPA: thioesterase II family protein [Staphylococcus aureus]
MDGHVIYCIPFAGGTKNIFIPLKNYVIDKLIIKPLELPGHGARFTDTLESEIEGMAEDITNQIMEHGYTEYSILGYSLGAIILYETYYKLKERGFSMPCSLIICAQEPIGYYDKNKKIENMDDFNFKNYIKSKGGTSDEVLYNEELWNIVSPILKNDFIAIDKYRNKQKSEKCKCPIYVFNGESDNISKEVLSKWSDITINDVYYKFFKGSHFFLFDNYKNIANELNDMFDK